MLKMLPTTNCCYLISLNHWRNRKMLKMSRPPSPTTPTSYRQFLSLHRRCLPCGSNVYFKRMLFR